MAGTFSGMAGVDDFDTGFVVFIDGCGRIDGMTKLTEDRTEVKDVFGSGNSSKKFSFGGAKSCNRLSLGAVDNCTTSKADSITSSGPTLAEIIGIGGINVTGQFGMVDGREVGKMVRESWRRRGEVTRRKFRRILRRWAASVVSNAKVLGAMEITNNSFEIGVMKFCRAS